MKPQSNLGPEIAASRVYLMDMQVFTAGDGIFHFKAKLKKQKKA